MGNEGLTIVKGCVTLCSKSAIQKNFIYIPDFNSLGGRLTRFAHTLKRKGYLGVYHHSHTM